MVGILLLLSCLYFSVYAQGQGKATLKSEAQKYDLLESFKSNRSYQDWVFQASNIIRFDLTTSNTLIAQKVLADASFFGNDLNAKVKFYAQCAEHFFDREGTAPYKQEAMKLWEEIVEIDLGLLKEYDPDPADIPTYASTLPADELEEALTMIRYLAWAADEEPYRSLDGQRMQSFCRAYEKYYTNGLRYSPALHLNFIEYYVSKKNVTKALYVYEKNKRQDRPVLSQ